MIKPKVTFLFALLFSTACVFAQEENLLESDLLNWYNLDWEKDNVLGAGVDMAYQDILSRKEIKREVIVAVIDNGIDIEHEDLKGRIWVNADEIPGNKIDDDGNGYVDDINGWNYLGNSQGENLVYENLEYTRLYRDYLSMIEEGREFLEDDESEEAVLYYRVKQLYEEEVEKRKAYLQNTKDALDALLNAKYLLEDTYGVEVNNFEDLEQIPVEPDNRVLMSARGILYNMYQRGYSPEMIKENKAINELYLDYYLNLKLDSRSVVGDNPKDTGDKSYGNPDVRGPLADHGTACASVIAAVRNNGIGINGIAENVKIMCLRTTPDGDERDKDVAFAIRYAVDNGANIINMSFGKDFSPQKQFVDEAVKYAEQNGVLIVHSSGNSGRDLREEPAFPNPLYADGTLARNWITVGASSMTLGKELPAPFSNYGKGQVDILAPGVDIVALDTGNTYSLHSGTSLSAPVVSGVAAVIWSYYPDLSTEELIALLVESSKIEKLKKVYAPGLGEKKRKKVKLEEVSTNGGVVNLYQTLLALESETLN